MYTPRLYLIKHTDWYDENDIRWNSIQCPRKPNLCNVKMIAQISKIKINK